MWGKKHDDQTINNVATRCLSSQMNPQDVLTGQYYKQRMVSMKENVKTMSKEGEGNS